MDHIHDMDYEEDPDAAFDAVVAHYRDTRPDPSPATAVRVLEDFLYTCICDTSVKIGNFNDLAARLANAPDVMTACEFVQNIILAVFLKAIDTLSDKDDFETDSIFAETFSNSLDRHEITVYAIFFADTYRAEEIIQQMYSGGNDIVSMFDTPALNSPEAIPICVYLTHVLLRMKEYNPLVSHADHGPPSITRFATHILQHINPTSGVAWQYLYASTNVMSVDIGDITHSVDAAAFMHSLAAYQNMCMEKAPTAAAILRPQPVSLRVRIRDLYESCFPDHWTRAGRGQPRELTRLDLPQRMPTVLTTMNPAETALFATLFLAIQRLEDTGVLLQMHQAVLETSLECWTNTDAFIIECDYPPTYRFV